MRQDAAHDEAVIVSDVADRDAEQIVPFARHGVALDDLLARLDESLELGAGVSGLVRHSDMAEDIDGAAERFRVRQADDAAQHAGLLQRPHPAPDRGGRGADLPGQRSETRRVGTECFRTCRYRWSPYN